ncbi:hypothetical protein M513_00645 [Trichuris suis]|uniref:Uncharacterized protein n=1 Tax=Trichuris suis TaxID=68888 RepID=A0A085MMH3_9BILA|nr:hypothetical protein M513_00645 [Trichuris suis]
MTSTNFLIVLPQLTKIGLLMIIGRGRHNVGRRRAVEKGAQSAFATEESEANRFLVVCRRNPP